MKKILVLSIVALFFSSCEKLALRFNSKAGDDLIWPDADLMSSTWTKLDSLTYLTLSDVSFCDENTGMISGFGGTVYTTTNGGETWRTINTNAHMTFLSCYSLNEKTYFTARHGLFKSTDYGTTWRATKLSTEISVFEIWFKDSKTGFLSSGAGTYRSTDAGETWSKIADEIAKNMQFTSEDIGYFSYGSTAVTEFPVSGSLPSSGDIYRTTNGGKTWKAMGLDVKEITAMSFISDKTGFFATIDNSIYKTTDGGETCTLIGEKEFHSYDLFFINENQGLVCTGKGISITTDGGKTFTPEYTYTGNGSIYDFEFPNPATGYAIGNNGVILKRTQ